MVMILGLHSGDKNLSEWENSLILGFFPFDLTERKRRKEGMEQTQMGQEGSLVLSWVYNS